MNILIASSTRQAYNKSLICLILFRIESGKYDLNRWSRIISCWYEMHCLIKE